MTKFCHSRASTASEALAPRGRSGDERPSPGKRLAARERRFAVVNLALAELGRDAKKLVVLRDPVAARQASRVDLSRVCRDGEVGDERVVGFARAVRDERAIAGDGGVADRI